MKRDKDNEKYFAEFDKKAGLTGSGLHAWSWKYKVYLGIIIGLYIMVAVSIFLQFF